MTQLRQVLAENIKKYRALRGFSQMRLAELSATAPNYIAMIETGRKFPSDRVLEKIAHALAVNAIDLFNKDTETVIAAHLEWEKTIHLDILNEITALIDKRIEKM